MITIDIVTTDYNNDFNNLDWYDYLYDYWYDYLYDDH